MRSILSLVFVIPFFISLNGYAFDIGKHPKPHPLIEFPNSSGNQQNPNSNKEKRNVVVDSAQTSTFNQSADGCIIGNTFISVFFETVQVNNQQPTTDCSVFILVTAFNQCEPGGGLLTVVEDAFGGINIDPSAFVRDKKLNTWSVNATGNIFDEVSGQNIPVTVNITWTGINEITIEKITDDTTRGSFRQTIRATELSRDANASGTITGEDDFNHSVTFLAVDTFIFHEEGHTQSN